MKKIIIPADLKGKELFKFLVANKSAIINQKKSMMQKGENIVCPPTYLFGKPEGETKASGAAQAPSEDTGKLRVKVVANTAMWCDSYMDVLLRDSATKSMKERKGMIPMIHDHIWTIDSEIGDVVSIYYQDVPLKDLGYKKEGSAQALIFEADILKAYNEKIYEKYRMGKVKQHSIGLNYIRIELAINDVEYEKEIDFWNKYYPELINPEAVDDKGYFWVVSEYKLMENSAVLFGANILTPTLSTESKSEEDYEEDESTKHAPLHSTHVSSQTESASVNEKGWDKIGDLFSKQLNKS